MHQDENQGVSGGSGWEYSFSGFQESLQDRFGGKLVEGVCCQKYSSQHPLYLQGNH